MRIGGDLELVPLGPSDQRIQRLLVLATEQHDVCLEQHFLLYPDPRPVPPRCQCFACFEHGITRRRPSGEDWNGFDWCAKQRPDNIVAWSDPGSDHTGVPVRFAHGAHLACAFGYVLLVDAHGVDPEVARQSPPQVSKRFVEIGLDVEGNAIQLDGVQGRRSAPAGSCKYIIRMLAVYSLSWLTHKTARYTPDERLDPRSRSLDECPLESNSRHSKAFEDDEDLVCRKEMVLV
jgi:hypothetical protein